MQQSIDTIKQQFEQELAQIHALKDVEALNVKYLGKKGVIADQMRFLRDVSAEDKPRYGKLFNDLKVGIEAALEATKSRLTLQEESARLDLEKIDVTLPGRRGHVGSKHPITQVMDEMISIFVEMGFSVESSPEIETDYYNFDILNFQPDHPAKDMQDTFYVAPHVLLRTHTSNSQGRVMESSEPPFRFISPGRCFRNETVSARSHVFFHQIEGLYVDEGVSLQDMMATLNLFLQKFFKKQVSTRFRPSYFPFVEPGCEVDIGCFLCNEQGCAVCKHSGWLEILGCGMIHPQVLRNCGIDSEKYTGFAWGMGIERVLMLQYGIPDIRILSENDLKFLSQYRSV